MRCVGAKVLLLDHPPLRAGEARRRRLGERGDHLPGVLHQEHLHEVHHRQIHQLRDDQVAGGLFRASEEGDPATSHAVSFTHSPLAQTAALFREGKVELPPGCEESLPEPYAAVADAVAEKPAHCTADVPPTTGATLPEPTQAQLSPLASGAKDGAASVHSGRGWLGDSAADVCRVVVLVVLLLFLFRSNSEWRAVNARLSSLESKIDLLDGLVAQILSAAKSRQQSSRL